MEKNEVLKRLGLADDKELLSLLDCSDRSERISRLVKKKINLKKLDSVVLYTPNSVTLQTIAYDKMIGPSENVCRKGFATVLKSRRAGEIPRKNTLKDPDNFPNGNIPKGTEKEWYFDRGHILGRQFHKYVLGNRILDKNFNNTNESWCHSHIDKKYNLFTQFSIANKRQAEIEEKIGKLLKSAEGEQGIYYEVKVIYNRKGRYPIGTDLFYVPLSNLENSHHYFIPNCDEGFEITDNDSGLSYRDFYENGYRKEYRPFFTNSDRDDWEIAEGISNNDFYLILKDSEEGIFSTERYEVDFETTSINSFKDINNKSLPPSGIFVFDRTEISEVDKFLKSEEIVTKSNKGKYYYPVNDLANQMGIYFKYGHNIHVSKNEHQGFRTLNEAINFKRW